MKQKTILLIAVMYCMIANVYAQKQYTYLKGQESPFNGEFNEPRYVGVDSILYYYYLSDDYPSATSGSYIGEIIPGFVQHDEGCILIKSSSDGLTDTLKYHLPRYGFGKISEYVKKYSEDGKLVSYSWDEQVFSDMGEKKYTYDAEGRISEITTIKNNDGAATVMVYDTIKFDYEFNLYLTGDGIDNNIIYTKNDTLFVFYSDEGYEIIDINKPEYDQKKTQYLFDSQNRLTKTVISYVTEPNADKKFEMKKDTIIEYKYTNNGYEEFLNEAKVAEYKFQDDGYCVEINLYEVSDAAVYPPRSKLKSIEKFSYFKDGKIIVDNESFELVAPKVYGVQGGIVVSAEKSLPVSIYTFSGGFVKQESVFAGTNTIPMTKGLYVVVIGSLSYKILVQ